LLGFGGTPNHALSAYVMVETTTHQDADARLCLLLASAVRVNDRRLGLGLDRGGNLG
jgi:hypothetical protein